MPIYEIEAWWTAIRGTDKVEIKASSPEEALKIAKQAEDDGDEDVLPIGENFEWPDSYGPTQFTYIDPENGATFELLSDDERLSRAAGKLLASLKVLVRAHANGIGSGAVFTSAYQDALDAISEAEGKKFEPLA